jgi:hypothetical protein
MVLWYNEHDGKADDFGELFIVKDAKEALAQVGDRYLHVPQINTFGGAPFAEHDQACAVCQYRHAVLDLNTGHFHPCGDCQLLGFALKKRPWWWPPRLWHRWRRDAA